MAQWSAQDFARILRDDVLAHGDISMAVVAATSSRRLPPNGTPTATPTQASASPTTNASPVPPSPPRTSPPGKTESTQVPSGPFRARHRP